MTKFIQHHLFYPNPPEVVWDYLTIPELMEKWLMPGNFKPEVGHEFQFKTNPKADFEFDGIFYCKVLKVVPNKQLSYSWKFGPGNGILHDSVVNWTLTAKDNGTELLLVHNGFEEGADIMPMFIAMNQGWLQNINKILRFLNSETDGTTQT